MGAKKGKKGKGRDWEELCRDAATRLLGIGTNGGMLCSDLPRNAPTTPVEGYGISNKRVVMAM